MNVIRTKGGILQVLLHWSLLPLFKRGIWPVGYGDFVCFRWWTILGQEIRWLYTPR